MGMAEKYRNLYLTKSVWSDWRISAKASRQLHRLKEHNSLIKKKIDERLTRTASKADDSIADKSKQGKPKAEDSKFISKTTNKDKNPSMDSKTPPLMLCDRPKTTEPKAREDPIVGRNGKDIEQALSSSPQKLIKEGIDRNFPGALKNESNASHSLPSADKTSQISTKSIGTSSRSVVHPPVEQKHVAKKVFSHGRTDRKPRLSMMTMDKEISAKLNILAILHHDRRLTR